MLKLLHLLVWLLMLLLLLFDVAVAVVVDVVAVAVDVDVDHYASSFRKEYRYVSNPNWKN